MRLVSASIKLTYALRHGIIYLIKRTVRLHHPVAKQNQGIRMENNLLRCSRFVATVFFFAKGEICII